MAPRSRGGVPVPEPAPAAARPAAPAAAGARVPAAEALGATGAPLVLWAGDPRAGTALVLARFSGSDLQMAYAVAAMWARRYDDLALGEAGADGAQPNVLALWRNGEPIANSQ